MIKSIPLIKILFWLYLAISLSINSVQAQLLEDQVEKIQTLIDDNMKFVQQLKDNEQQHKSDVIEELQAGLEEFMNIFDEEGVYISSLKSSITYVKKFKVSIDKIEMRNEDRQYIEQKLLQIKTDLKKAMQDASTARVKTIELQGILVKKAAFISRLERLNRMQKVSEQALDIAKRADANFKEIKSYIGNLPTIPK